MIWNYLGKEVTSIMINGKMIKSLYRGGNLVWESVLSCFGSGNWVGTKPWLNKEKWKSHK